MNKKFIFLSFVFFYCLYATPVDWGSEQEIVLKKDEMVSAKVYANRSVKNFTMRWTLLKKDGIVVLLKYDDFPYQFILYLDYQRNRYDLLLDGSDNSRLVILYKDFDFSSRNAKFWLGVQGQADFVLNR
ncbi:hypothetical protein LW135_05510 [Helicobacter sp. faydin-H20]|uniref:hypothetical protein n=1 Tax=Helicobacter anatolicus TaxID=2905874 RepID=UPI001E3F6E6E|nr:hypothetical protein [Helicobacter anatolicus]MCE3037287.1 hypothetical protein [Helicobacter anatolicus]